MERMHKPVLALALLLGFPALAPAKPYKFSNGVELTASANSSDPIRLRRGGEGTVLPKPRAFGGLESVREENGVATLVYRDYCTEKSASVQYQLVNLAARIENAVAYRLHRQKKYLDASAGFARAVALDPNYTVARTNLASAETLRGDRRAAVNALAPLLAARPFETYAKVLTDPELAPLREEPELAAQRFRTPGTVTIRRDKGRFAMSMMVSGEHKFLAVQHTLSDGMSMRYGYEVRFYDTGSGTLLFAVPIVKMEETDAGDGHWSLGSQKLVDARLKGVNQLLADLGFAPVRDEAQRFEFEKVRDQVWKAQLHGQKLALVVSLGHVRLFAGAKQLRQFASPDDIANVNVAVWIPSAKVAVYDWDRPVGDVCDFRESSGEVVVPIP
jgi:hypothetical protein